VESARGTKRRGNDCSSAQKSVASREPGTAMGARKDVVEEMHASWAVRLSG
jgi:hypothetical protein